MPRLLPVASHVDVERLHRSAGFSALSQPGCRIRDAIRGPIRRSHRQRCRYGKCSLTNAMLPATCVPTPLEKGRPLRVDALVPEPIFASTHAITIDAPPERVWPWIAQMGAGRAGWYSWDGIDNGGTPSRTRIVPELQSVARGDIMPAVPGAMGAFVVAAVDPPRDLVLTVPDGRGGNAVGWEHVLDPLPGGRTRLIVRGRASSQWLALASATPATDHQPFLIERVYAALAMLPGPLLIAVATLGHRIMEARHLRGLQRRSTAASALRRTGRRKTRS